MNIQNAETKIQRLDLDHVRAYLAEKRNGTPHMQNRSSKTTAIS